METTPLPHEPMETTETGGAPGDVSASALTAPAGDVDAAPRATASSPAAGETEQGNDAQEGIRKALRDTKAWATRLNQENISLRRALETSLSCGDPSAEAGALAADQLARTRRALERHEEFGPLLELVETVIRQVALFEREMSHQSLVQAVLADHPDALELRRDDEFLAWVDKQPPVVRLCLHHSEHPADVNWALELFKREREETRGRDARRAAEAERAARMRHAATPSARIGAPNPAPRFSRDDIARMSVEEYRKNEGAINEALARGEIA